MSSFIFSSSSSSISTRGTLLSGSFVRSKLALFSASLLKLLIIENFPVTGRAVDVDAWSRPAVVKYVFELSL